MRLRGHLRGLRSATGRRNARVFDSSSRDAPVDSAARRYRCDPRAEAPGLDEPPWTRRAGRETYNGCRVSVLTTYRNGVREHGTRAIPLLTRYYAARAVGML